MKVVLLTLNNFTHDTRIQRTAFALCEVGYQVTVLALWQKGLLEHENNPSGYSVERIRLASRSWRNRWLGPFVKYLEYALRVWKITGKYQADVYHANDANTLPAAWLAARRNNARLVYDAHELETGRNWVATRVAGIYKHLTIWPEKVFIRRADAVITVNHSIANRLAELYQIPTPTVVMNCPVSHIDHSNQTRSLRKELNIPGDLRIALYQGGVTRGRGIEAFLLAVQSTPGVTAVILGDGTLLGELRRRVQNNEYQRVFLPGKVDPSVLHDYTASADFAIALIEPLCESYRLSLPNKIFEYMHAGLPVIGSNLPEISRVVHEEQIGLVVDPQNPVEITGALQRLLADPQASAAFKSHALVAARKYTWENERVKLLDVYKELSASKGDGSEHRHAAG